MFRFIVLIFMLIQLGRADMENTVYDEFVVSLWPEYDHPGVLVLYSGKVNPAQLPHLLEIRVPVQTQQVLAMGTADTSRKLVPVEIVDRGSQKWVALQLTQPSFHVEFYYDPFSGDHTRRVEYDLLLGETLETYQLALQKPIMAENYTVSEPGMETFQDQHGMTFYRKRMPGLRAGEVKHLEITYENHSGTTSIQKLQEMLAGGSPGGMGSGGQTATPISTPPRRHRLPLFEPLLALLAVAVVVYVVFRQNYKRASAGPAPVQRRKGTTPKSLPPEPTRYCSQCGKILTTGGKFCPHCGTKI